MLPDSIFRTQTFHFGDATFSARIPDPALLSNWYHQQPDQPQPSDLFWARIWPSGLGLCQWLAQHPEVVKDKTVLEIAAGLGLPSLLIAPIVKTITCTDIHQQSVETIRQSARLNGYDNLFTAITSWASVPEECNADVLLLSDVNYDPSELDSIRKLIKRFIDRGSAVILSTPERIVARSFLEEWLPYQSKHESFPIEQETIHVYVLS
jgi:predicted nicotinamide N-methyase